MTTATITIDSFPVPSVLFTRQYSDEWFMVAWRIFNSMLDESASKSSTVLQIKDDLRYWQQTFNNIESREGLSEDQRRRLRKLLDGSVARWFRCYVKIITIFGEDWAADNGLFRAYGIMISRKLTRIEKQRLSSSMRRDFAALANSSQLGVLGDGSVQPLQLPKPDALSASLRQSFERLREDWTVAHEQIKHIEGQHLLTQMAVQYLPETIALYVSAQSLFAEQKEEAEALVAEQLELLHAQVKRLLESNRDGLSGLRAQTEFIREISRRAAPSNLQLHYPDGEKPNS